LPELEGDVESFKESLVGDEPGALDDQDEGGIGRLEGGGELVKAAYFSVSLFGEELLGRERIGRVGVES